MDSPCIKQTVRKVLKIFQYGKYLVAYVLNTCILLDLPIGREKGSFSLNYFQFRALIWRSALRGSRTFARGGHNMITFFSLFFFFFLMRGKVEPNSTIKRQRNAIYIGVSLAGRWWPNIECCLGSFVIFRESATVLIINPIFLWFFREVRTPYHPSGSAHACLPYMSPRVHPSDKLYCVVSLSLDMCSYPVELSNSEIVYAD